VEHPITEMVTGVDLVRWQIRIARGERLSLDPRRLLEPHGHAIECRIYAEDPDNNFLPSPGRIEHLRVPSGPGIREDSGATAGLDVPIFYDPIVSKLIAWAEDRPSAVSRMQRALREYVLVGIKTTLPFFAWLFDQPEFHAGAFHTTYLDDVLKARNGRPFSEPDGSAQDLAAVAAALRVALAPQAAAALHSRALTPASRASGATGWKARARTEALR
jgi:acetyl-CoA carboxylase biotin carboxylase subunit